MDEHKSFASGVAIERGRGVEGMEKGGTGKERRKGAVKVRGTPKIRLGRCAAVKLTFSYVSLKFSSAAQRPYKGVLDPTF